LKLRLWYSSVNYGRFEIGLTFRLTFSKLHLSVIQI
ncbi:hypothetical protein Leryth_019862, partial [Lithospermum erythrorhizon]